MKKVLLYLFTFIAVQLFIMKAVCSLWLLADGSTVTEAWQYPLAEATAPMIITATVLYDVILMFIFIKFRWSVVSPNYLRTRQWGVFFWSIVAAVGTIIPSIWIQEQLPELPDTMEKTFAMIMSHDYGYFAICIFAPLVEELIFRGAILRSLLGVFSRHCVPVILSALLFAFVHGNLAQMPHAFLIGLLLGWMYYRTGSILPGVAFHWVNNTIAFVFFRVAPQMQDMRMIEFFHGNHKAVVLSVIFSMFILLPSLYQLHCRMKR